MRHGTPPNTIIKTGRKRGIMGKRIHRIFPILELVVGRVIGSSSIRSLGPPIRALESKN